MAESKLANPVLIFRPSNGPKPRFDNAKKRVTGHSAHSASARDRRDDESAQISGSARLGTAHAIKENVLSQAVPRDASPRPFTKVERHRKGRRSTALRLSEVRNIMAAAVFTAEEHRPLNRHTTVHFDAAGIADPVAAIRSYMKLARDWLHTQGAPFAYIWVRESGKAKGEHAHILMHVPSHLISQFARRERGWRKRIGAERRKGSFHSTPIGRSYRHAEIGVQYGQSYADALAGMIGYLVKSADPRAVRALKLTRVEPGGELCGKRSGTSENIGRSARERRIK